MAAQSAAESLKKLSGKYIIFEILVSGIAGSC
jgi:hypothetical protein